jgi:hypothetical protein
MQDHALPGTKMGAIQGKALSSTEHFLMGGLQAPLAHVFSFSFLFWFVPCTATLHFLILIKSQ